MYIVVPVLSNANLSTQQVTDCFVGLRLINDKLGTFPFRVRAYRLLVSISDP